MDLELNDKRIISKNNILLCLYPFCYILIFILNSRYLVKADEWYFFL